MTWRGPSSLLQLPAMLQSANAFLGANQGSQMKSTQLFEYAFQSMCCPNRGLLFCPFPALHRQVKNADKLFKGKAGAYSVVTCNDSPQSSPIFM